MAVKDRKTRLAVEIDLKDIQQAQISFRGLGNAIEDLIRRRKKSGKIDGVEKFRANASRMMFNIFYNFTVDVYETLVDFTPIGNKTRIRTDKEYNRMYRRRLEDHGIAMTPGYHKGAWQFSLEKNAVFNDAVYPENQANRAFKANLRNFYSTFRDEKYRGSVYVSAIGPAYALIEKGIIKNADKNKEGIIKPSLDLIMQYYK